MESRNSGEERRATATLALLSKQPLARARVSIQAARRHGRLNTISRRLFKAFPRAFKYPPVPLAIAIGPKLCELMRPEFKPAEVRAFLQAWTSGPRYLKAVLRGEMRRNLDGSPASCRSWGIALPPKSGLKQSGTRAHAPNRDRSAAMCMPRHCWTISALPAGEASKWSCGTACTAPAMNASAHCAAPVFRASHQAPFTSARIAHIGPPTS
ncbi:MAG: hypothetical protein JO166_12895 [Deltaproteobacteria bacterium]|nr:hypothetical protein [Deltaproteobacteria bacterium]